jgi:Right handed beta helix region
MIRIIAKLFAVAVVLIAFLPVAPLHAAPVVWISSTGKDTNPCTAALPCASFFIAFSAAANNGQVSCLNAPSDQGNDIYALPFTITIDYPGGVWAAGGSVNPAMTLASNFTLKIRHVTFSGNSAGMPAIKVLGSGTLILEDCVFENYASSTALDIEPNGALNLVITNSRISNSAGGVLIEPQAGGSVTATLNGVTIADNSGGGLKTETINGPVTVDISNSTISKNAGNGLNAVGGAGGPNMLNIIHDVIASNGNAGIQANGTNAAALVNGSVLDSNTAGATAVVGAGRILTYGNNSVIGTPGSGFTGTASLQ